jgi:hypothetical protein
MRSILQDDPFILMKLLIMKLITHNLKTYFKNKRAQH